MRLASLLTNDSSSSTQQDDVQHLFCGRIRRHSRYWELNMRGRMPSNDVIDFQYSLFLAGLSGFNVSNFAPNFVDGAAPHVDTNNTTFPFLGPTH